MKIQIINPYLFKIRFNIIFLFSTPNSPQMVSDLEYFPLKLTYIF